MSDGGRLFVSLFERILGLPTLRRTDGVATYEAWGLMNPIAEALSWPEETSQDLIVDSLWEYVDVRE